MNEQTLWRELYLALRTGKIEWPAMAYAESTSIVLVLNKDFRVMNGVPARKGPLALCAQWKPNDLVGRHVFPELVAEIARWQGLEMAPQAKDWKDNTTPSFLKYSLEDQDILAVYFPLHPGILVAVPVETLFDGWARILEPPTTQFLGGSNTPVKSKSEKIHFADNDKPKKGELENVDPALFNTQNGADARRHRVLIADDDPLLARALSRALKESFDVQVAKGGAGALEFLEQETYDVVLCDLTMPDVSGAQVFERVKEMCPEQLSSFVFMTGGVFNDAMSHFLDDVPNPVVDKPFDLRDLREMLHRHARREER